MGIGLAEDLPVLSGVGFDLVEYPAASQDTLEAGMMLQVCLGVDDESLTALLVDMLSIGSDGGTWISRQ